MERLAFMAGRWDVRTHSIVEGEWAETRAERIAIVSILDGQFLRFALEAEFQGNEFVAEMTLSFDVARSVYRMTLNDTMMGYMDVYQGDFADGVLQLSNETTGTGFPLDEGMQFGRVDIRQTSADTLSLEVTYSDDSGGLWQNYNRIYFKRIPE